MEIIIYGLCESFVILLFALGFHLVFGLGGVVHLSYGAFAIGGAYAIGIFYWRLGWAPPLAILVGIALVTLLVFIFYKFLLSRTQGLMINEALISLAVLLIIMDVIMLTCGTAPVPFPNVWPERLVPLFGTQFELSRLGVIIIAPLICLGIWWFLKHTTGGRGMWALSADREVAMLMGVAPVKLITYMIVIATIVSMVGAFLSLSFLGLSPVIGELIILWVLFAVILGGVGSFKGMVLASFIIGFSEAITASMLGSELKLLAPLVIILLIIVFRPSGIFGVATKLEERL